MPVTFGTPEYWRARAEEARTLAEQMTNPDARKATLEAAAGYELLANRADAKQRRPKAR